MSTSRIKYYKSFDEDVVTLKNQNYQLPPEYNYSTSRLKYRILAPIVSTIAWILGWFYDKFFLHLKFENEEILKEVKNTGYFVYGNHTLPVADSLSIFLLEPLTKVSAIVTAANLAIPVVGSWLTYGGVVPIPTDRHRLLEFNQAVVNKIKNKKSMFIYPEAHVWPYYTKIRPLNLGSFHYPVETGAPVYCKTTTFQKRRWGKRPKITVYIDGPIDWNRKQSKIDQEKELLEKVQATLEQRSKLSTYEYIHYKKRNNK